MTAKRDRSRDGLILRVQVFFLMHFKWIWLFLMKYNFTRRFLNRWVINLLLAKMPPRPTPLSTLSPYTSWDSLTDKSYKGRALPPMSDDKIAALPPIEEVVKLFERKPGKEVLSDKTSLLLSYFAVWFFEPIVSTDPTDNLKNRSNHIIDLLPVYGRNREVTNMLRSHKGGKLKSQMINEEEYPPYYYENGVVKEEFKDLELTLFKFYKLDQEKQDKLFALGLEKGNRQIGTMMMSTLFLREHNRLCDVLHKNYPDWDDERLFQTARNILLVIHLRIILEEYLNTINPFIFQAWLDPYTFKSAPWLRSNWISVEFDLIYRWHSLMPENINVDGKLLPMHEFIGNSDLMVRRGLGACFESASKQPSGKIGLGNSHKFLRQVEFDSIKLGRDAKLKGFNDYRELICLPRFTEFNQITANEEVQKELKRLYGHPDNIEFYVGMFAEDPWENDVVPNTMRLYLAVDAISQVFTHPLLSPRVFNEETFSPVGMEIINQTKNIQDLVNRNTPPGKGPFKVSMSVRSGPHTFYR